MEPGNFPSIVMLLSTVLLALLLSPVSGKCRGRWAIHACFGGNGKRSDPRLQTNLPSSFERHLPPTINSERSPDAKLLALLKSDFRSSLEQPSQPSGHSASQHRTFSHIRPDSDAGLLHRLLFTDVARLIQEDELSRENAVPSPPEGVLDRESTRDQQLPMEIPDLDALRSFVAALKLEHALRAEDRQESEDDNLMI